MIMFSEPKRIQLRRTKGWRMPENTVKVDRSTKWGNPFIVGKHGTQAKCVELYRYLVGGHFWMLADVKAQKAARLHIKTHINELKGKNLACWCKEGTPCHADVLLEMANSDVL